MSFRLPRRQFFVAYYATRFQDGAVATGMNLDREAWDRRREDLRVAGFESIAVHYPRPEPETTQRFRELMARKAPAVAPTPTSFSFDSFRP